MSDDKRYFGIMMEELRDQYKVIMEAVGDMQENVAPLPAIQQDIATLKEDVRTIKYAVTDLSRQVTRQEVDIRVLKSHRAAA